MRQGKVSGGKGAAMSKKERESVFLVLGCKGKCFARF